MEEIKEIWKDIEGWEGLYQVSNLGNVKAMEHVIPCKSNGRRTLPEKMLKPNINPKTGYYGVILSSKPRNRKPQLLYIHRLVAQAFLENPDNLPCINHKDENKGNNVVTNLEYCTHKYNMNFGTGIQRRAIAAIEKRFQKKGNYCSDREEVIINHFRPIYFYNLEGECTKSWKSMKEVLKKETLSDANHIRSCANYKKFSKRFNGYFSYDPDFKLPSEECKKKLLKVINELYSILDEYKVPYRTKVLNERFIKYLDTVR